jgi:hypothetical protein
MSLNSFVFSLGCLLAWLILMPIVVIGGGIALFVYAVFAELTQLLTGRKEVRPDPTTAHAMAAKICMPYAPRRVTLSQRPL